MCPAAIQIYNNSQYCIGHEHHQSSINPILNIILFSNLNWDWQNWQIKKIIIPNFWNDTHYNNRIATCNGNWLLAFHLIQLFPLLAISVGSQPSSILFIAQMLHFLLKTREIHRNCFAANRLLYAPINCLYWIYNYYHPGVTYSLHVIYIRSVESLLG